LDIFPCGIREGRTKMRPAKDLKRQVFLVLASFSILLSARAAEISCVWSGVEKIVAVGDLHGDYENFVKILLGTGLVDEKLRWAGGGAHFVQTGDIMDRGPGAKMIFDVLRRLEKEAGRAGGKVHVLLGNHEELNITGIAFDYPDYITVEQFVSFLPRDYRRQKEREFLKRTPSFFTHRNEELSDADTLGHLLEFWKGFMKTDDAQRFYIESFNDTYGKWLLEKNAVIRINDTIFVHGGISEKYSTWKLETINSLLRNELSFFKGRRNVLLHHAKPFEAKIVYDANGPLWFRDLAVKDEKSLNGEFERILKNLGAGHMVIAHTFYRGNGVTPVVAPRFMSRFNGKLWIIDTGISSYYGGINSALLIEKENFMLWGDTEADEAVLGITSPGAAEDGGGSAGDLEDYLRKAGVGTIIRGAQRGRTEPWTIILDDGQAVRRAIFKYVDRRRPSLLPDSFNYEIAAYELSKLLGLDIVPAVVERQIEGTKGSLQAFVESAVPETARRRNGPEPPEPLKFREALETIKVFAMLVNDACENLEDTLVQTGNWRVFRVDFSEAFAPSPELRPDCGLTSCPDELDTKLRDLDDRVIGQKLAPYLNKDEIEALIRRKGRLIRLLEDLKN
jgi:hypothetical protein